MPQSICTLDGYAFAYNPYPYVNAPVKSTGYTPTLGGGVQTTFLSPATGGTFVQDQEIEMSWPVMNTTMFNTLATKFQKPGTLVFIDPYEVQYTVRFTYLTPQSLLKGGDDALEGVKARLRVISQP